MPAPKPQSIIDQIVPLHEQGLSDREIASRLGIGFSTAQRHLRGKRTHLVRKHRQYVDDKHAICSECEMPKHIDEFPTPCEDNGRGYRGELSFCKECRYRRAFDKQAESPEAYIRKRVTDLECRCSIKKIPFNLPVEFVLELYQKQKGLCFYTDQLMTVTPGGSKRRSHGRDVLSFDRIIPEVGYVQGNVVLCSFRANAIKQDQSLTELAKWMPDWYARLVKSGLVSN